MHLGQNEHFEQVGYLTQSGINNNMCRVDIWLLEHYSKASHNNESPLNAILGTRKNSHYVDITLSETCSFQTNSLSQCDSGVCT